MAHAETKVARGDIPHFGTDIGDAEHRAVAWTDREVVPVGPGQFGALADQRAHGLAADLAGAERRVLEVGKFEGVLGREQDLGGHGGQHSSVQRLTEAPLFASKI